MANVVFSSCCYNFVFSATTFPVTAATNTVYVISGDTNIPNGCYKVVTGVTASTISTTVTGTATSGTSCNDPS